MRRAKQTKVKRMIQTETVLNIVKKFDPDKVILLPLYPQYSAATSGSSIKEWNEVCKKNNYKIKTSTICCYPTDENFIKSMDERLDTEWIVKLDDSTLIIDGELKIKCESI